MELTQSKRIISRFLIEQSADSSMVRLEDEDLEQQMLLITLLNFISAHNQNIFDFANVADSVDQWQELSLLLNQSISMKSGSPPVITDIDLNYVEEALYVLKNTHELNQLPKPDYYNRPIVVSSNEELDNLIKDSRARLYALIQTFSEPFVFEANNVLQIMVHITRTEEHIKTYTEHTPQYRAAQNKLVLLKDLKKINELQYIAIPQDNKENFNYCILSEPTGGVTKKISLIRFERVKLQLGHLIQRTGTLTASEYIEEHEQYQLQTEAIIKLPKHGYISEIQHEAVALSISHMMGLDTTEFTLVSYEDQPALFIPFAPIRLLNEFTLGKKLVSGIGFFGHTYTDYSTIKPVGEGLQADSYIEDFGKALGLFYLCSDPDGIGGYCQNKGLKNNKTLFIFDQALSDYTKFIMNSQFNLHSALSFIWKTRHNTGRNRTLIEDSSFNMKYESIMQLRSLKPKLLHYLEQIMKHYQKQAEHIRSETPTLTVLLLQLQTLIFDTQVLKDQITKRIDAIEELLPQHPENMDDLIIRQALVFEKLLKSSRLFSDDGRPYKNPWATEKSIRLIRIEKHDDQLKFYFNEAVPEPMLRCLKHHGTGDSLTLESPEIICIDKEQLYNLREDMIYPEHQFTLLHHVDYLSPTDLTRLSEAYYFGNRHRITRLIETYRNEMHHPLVTPAKKISCIQETEEQLIKLISTARDKGFGKHVLKKFYFDAQKMLQVLMNPSHRPACIDEAFSAALRLDRVAEFNAVVLEAVKQNKMNTSAFIAFLESCIAKVKMITDYSEACNQSAAFLTEVEKIREHLVKGSATILSELLQMPAEIETSVVPDPLMALRQGLKQERNLFEQPNDTETVSVPLMTDASTAVNINPSHS